MVRNVRWLYSKLGTEDFSAIGGGSVTGALSSLQSELDGKSPSSHNHSTSSLPVSSNQVNSVNYIPSSAMLYSMAQRVEGIQTLIATAKRELDDPNKRYESKSLGTWSSVSDVDTFLSQYTHENNYEGLSLGNYVTIRDGTFNVVWEIAGFDMECCQIAADSTVYDNGYGICMIPKSYISSAYYHSDNVPITYITSGIHGALSTTITNALKNVLVDHMVDRNVLLSSSLNSNYYSNAYTWTTVGPTLMSAGQCTGTFGNHSTKYDDGEANYKLPLFNYENYYNSYNFWLRGIYGSYFGNGAWYVGVNGSLTSKGYNSSNMKSRPLIYIR